LLAQSQTDLTCQENEYLTQAIRDVCQSCNEEFPNSYTCNSEEPLSCINNLSLMGGQCRCLNNQYLQNNYCYSCAEAFAGSATCSSNKPLTCAKGFALIDGQCVC